MQAVVGEMVSVAQLDMAHLWEVAVALHKTAQLILVAVAVPEVVLAAQV